MDILTTIGIVLLVVGLILIGVEMVIPGFGVPGISGIICVLAGIFLTAKSIEQGLTITVIVVVILAVMLTAVLVYFHSKKIKSPIMLAEELKAEDPFLSKEDLGYLVGKEGNVITDLRPIGKCNIEGVVFEVRSDGPYVSKGNKVKIVMIQESTLIAREIV